MPPPWLRRRNFRKDEILQSIDHVQNNFDWKLIFNGQLGTGKNALTSWDFVGLWFHRRLSQIHVLGNAQPSDPRTLLVLGISEDKDKSQFHFFLKVEGGEKITYEIRLLMDLTCIPSNKFPDRTFRTLHQRRLSHCLFKYACLCHCLCLSSCFERKIIYELRSITDRPHSPSRPFALSSLSHYINYLPGRDRTWGISNSSLKTSQELHMLSSINLCPFLTVAVHKLPPW